MHAKGNPAEKAAVSKDLEKWHYSCHGAEVKNTVQDFNKHKDADLNSGG